VTPQIHALCREALSRLDARVLAQLAATADPFGPEVEPDLGERALAAAESSGDAEAMSLALQARHTELLDPRHVHERLALGARAIEFDPCWGHTWRLNAFAEMGNGPRSPPSWPRSP
jgi:hypothetical protein